jgi:ectoine hydroxylase-related dioxygenase (phytanoyl-CoA dioxygenase family)
MHPRISRGGCVCGGGCQAVWKDKDIETGFPWHWDNTYWGGAPKVSTWVALDDADTANGCLQLVAGSHKLTAELRERFGAQFRRQRADDEDPWLHRSGAPPTKGDDFAIAEGPLDAFLAPYGLRRETHPAKAGDVLFFSSFTLHASHRNEPGSKVVAGESGGDLTGYLKIACD